MNCDFYKIISTAGLILIFTAFIFAQAERDTGIELFKQGKNKESVAALEKASKKFKTDAEIWNVLGLAYTKDEAYKKAVKAFEKAVSINGQSAAYQTNLAYAYFLNNKLDKAQSASTKAIELAPESAIAYYIRGAASVWEGDNDNAMKDADKAISFNADYSQAYILKADALLADFGRRVGGGAKPFDEVYLLEQAQKTLENCLKNCKNNSQVQIQEKRLDTLQVFYKYFSKNRDALINQASGLPNQVIAAPPPPPADPNFTPLKIIKKMPASYTGRARENGIEGTIRIAVLFSESGRVTHTLILKGLGGGLDENAVKAARQIQFEPARRDGKPISQIKIVEYSFDIY